MKQMWKFAHAFAGAELSVSAACIMKSYSSGSCCGSLSRDARRSAVNRLNVVFSGDGDGGVPDGRMSRMVKMSRPGRMSATQLNVARGIDSARVRVALLDAPAGTRSAMRPCWRVYAARIELRSLYFTVRRAMQSSC